MNITERNVLGLSKGPLCRPFLHRTLQPHLNQLYQYLENLSPDHVLLCIIFLARPLWQI